MLNAGIAQCGCAILLRLNLCILAYIRAYGSGLSVLESNGLGNGISGRWQTVCQQAEW